MGKFLSGLANVASNNTLLSVENLSYSTYCAFRSRRHTGGGNNINDGLVVLKYLLAIMCNTRALKFSKINGMQTLGLFHMNKTVIN